MLVSEKTVAQVGDLAKKVQSDGLVPLRNPVDQPICHTANLVVENQLLHTLAVFKIEHSRTGDDIDAGEGCDYCSNPRFKPSSKIDQFRVASAHVGVSWQGEVFPDLGIGHVYHHCLDGPNRSGTCPHIKNRRRPSPDQWRARAGNLPDDDSRKAFCRMLHNGTEKGNRRSGTGKWHRHEFRRDTSPCTVNHALSGKIVPFQRGRRTGVKYRQRLLP